MDMPSATAVDCHAHLADPEFADDLQAVLQSAEKAGVSKIIAVSMTNDDVCETLRLAEVHAKLVAPCAGIHPIWHKNGNPMVATMDQCEGMTRFIREHSQSLVGIGEVGLDFTPAFIQGDIDKAVQREILRRQVQVALDLGLPLNVHSRSAGRPVVNLLKEAGARAVLLHAFDGNPKVAKQGVDMGWYFSIPPSIARSEGKKRLVTTVPLEQLVLETDSPALGPVAQVSSRHGANVIAGPERNVPSNIFVAAQAIADAKGVSMDEVLNETTANAMRLFPKAFAYVESGSG